MQLRVSATKSEAQGRLDFKTSSVKCALGPVGMVTDKREGDGGTPIATMGLLTVYYRPDRVERPRTELKTEVIRPDMCWCDDPKSPAYNMLISQPFSGSCETMWREDHVYDICVVLDWNMKPAVPGKGSAIFFHLARENYSPTEGCIAVSLDDMYMILANCQQDSAIITALVS